MKIISITPFSIKSFLTPPLWHGIGANLTQNNQTTKQTTTNNPHKSHKTHKEYNRYEDEDENEDETHPPPLRYALVHPVSGGQLAGAVIT